MDAVLISIHPQWCEKIFSGEKTIEIRKTKPNLSTPFKCYVYETKGRMTLKEKAPAPWDGDEMVNFYIHEGSGKIIGEFICDKIDIYEMEGFTRRENVYQAITRIEVEDGDELQYTEAANDMSPEELSKSRIIKESRVKFDDIGKYACGAVFGFYKFYGWHISNYKKYTTPKELHEFRAECPEWSKGRFTEKCEKCENYYVDYRDCCSICLTDGELEITGAPQSWRYVIDVE